MFYKSFEFSSLSQAQIHAINKLGNMGYGLKDIRNNIANVEIGEHNLLGDRGILRLKGDGNWCQIVDFGCIKRGRYIEA
jgi:hypothetical protein